MPKILKGSNFYKNNYKVSNKFLIKRSILRKNMLYLEYKV